MKTFLSLLFVISFVFDAHALEVGDAAPCVILDQITTDGQTVEQCIREPRIPGQLKVLEFFAVNCSACRINLPIVSSLHQQYGETVTFRLISIDRSEQAVRSYRTEFQQLINFPLALDLNRDVKSVYQVQGTPTIFVLDENDIVIYKHVGILGAGDIAQLGAIFNRG